ALNLLFDAAANLQQFLCAVLVVPEIRRGGLRFDLVQLLATCRDIKETSRAAVRARAGRRRRFVVPELIKFPYIFCRGGPPWPPVAALTRSRAATESRPYHNNHQCCANLYEQIAVHGITS